MKQTGYALEDSKGRIHAGSFSETVSEMWSSEAFDYLRFRHLALGLPWKDWIGARDMARRLGYRMVRVRLVPVARKARKVKP